jgi:carboxymethylenebutenolidase
VPERVAEQVSGNHLDLLAETPHARMGRQNRKVGSCMGDGLSLRLACVNPELAAAVIFYGRNPKPIDGVNNLQYPLIGNYTSEDRGINEADVNMLKETLTKYGKTFDIKIFPDFPHGFFNDTRESYRPDATKETWARVLNFYAKYLK